MIWLERACTFLVISCPCALVISVPMGFFGGIGASSKEGVLVKGSNYLELLSDMDTIVFDKTGTLTNGVFEVTEVHTERYTKEEVLQFAAGLEKYSTHPIAESIVRAWNAQVEVSQQKESVSKQEMTGADGLQAEPVISEVEEISGCGIRGTLSGKQVLAGNEKLMRQYKIEFDAYKGNGTVVYVAVDGVYAGCIVISDTVKTGVKEAIADLKKAGIAKTVMLTGDRKETALAVAEELGIDEVHYELLPADKVAKVETLLQKQSEKKKLAFVGDGINDAPVLARVDIGFAMGSLGSDAAIEAADVVIMDDDLRKIAKVMRISRKTMAIVKENIVFALGVKGLILILGAVGRASMWAAVFADVGVAVIAILNSMRTLKK